LQGERLAKLAGYWRNRLAGVAPLNLPADRQRPSQPSHRGKTLDFTLSAALSQSLSDLARAADSSLYMLLLTAFQVLLHRYCGQDDIAVGSPIANRTRLELEGLYGFFVNTLVMRVDCANNPTFRALLAQVRQNALMAYEHQELPFEKLVEELHPVRTMGRNPLFDVIFALQNEPRTDAGLAGTVMQRLKRTVTTSKFDLSVFLYQRDGTIDGSVEYATDLFDESTIQRMLGHFQTLLTGIVTHPDCRIGELPLLTVAERHELLTTWNATAREYPHNQCLHQLFEQQAAARPTATALHFGDSRLSYGELNGRANGMAHALHRLGVGPGVVVGLGLPRSPEMIVALLAILKAGGAYVPCDAGLPAARIHFMVQDASLSLILTDAAGAGAWQGTGARIVVLDEVAAAAPIAANRPCATTPDDLAYIMYTSGSTGRPKGVAIGQRAVVRLVCNVDYVRLGPDETLLQLAPLAFDASTFEIWGALLHGAALVLAPEGMPDYGELEQLLSRHGVSVLWLTAGLFNNIVEQRPQMLRGVRQLITGGQALSVHHVRLALAQLPHTEISNGYGPTENTTFTCTYAIPRPLPADWTAIPIGRPVPNTQVYILDTQLEPTPAGVTGELYASGAGLARGYAGRPALTAETFIAHPFQPGQRLYRTGDLARWRRDGVIEFMGRRDRQVKVRGYRIEPGEVEAALRSLPAVHDAAVVALQQEAEQRLVAYLVVDPARQPGADQLRAALAAELPAYMIPGSYLFVDALPLTANGKVDVHALAALHAQAARPAHWSIPPRDPLELQLAHIWERVLGVTAIGVHDDFFDLGGYSLLAVTLLEQVARATGRRLPLTTLFETPTVAALAQALRDRDWMPNWSTLTPIQAGGARTPLFLVPPAASSPLRFRALAGHLGPDQPLYAFHPVGLDDDRTPHATVEAMAAAYLQELQRFLPNGPYLLGGMCFGALVALEMACQLQESGAPVLGLIVLDASPPNQGPGWQVELASKTPHYFVRRLRHYRTEGKLASVLLRNFKAALRWPLQRFKARFDVHERRHQRTLAAHRAAQRIYQARPLAGRLLLVNSEEFARAPHLIARWSALGAGGVESHVVTGAHHRALLMDEPFLGQLAALVRDGNDRLHGAGPNAGKPAEADKR
jgi:amino acid adenylation domain-containing protein